MKKKILLLCSVFYIAISVTAQTNNNVPKETIRNLKIAENNGITMLEWNVYYLLTPAKFIIEKSSNGEPFEVIGEKMSFPSYFDAVYYFYDKTPNTSNAIYRVRLINTVMEEEISTASLESVPLYPESFAKR